MNINKNYCDGKPKQIFNSLLELMDPAQSYANYRLRLKTANPPCIPFLFALSSSLLLFLTLIYLNNHFLR